MKLQAPLLAILSLALAVGCGKGQFASNQAKGRTDDVFRYPINTKPTTLDPQVVQDGDTIDLLQQVYEGLTTWGENNQPVPNLAEKWDVLDGGKTYVFHLKHGVKFHNGREVTADDFKYTFERAANPALSGSAAMASNYLDDIVGVEDRIAKKAQDVKGVQVVDPYTLKITLKAPRPYFLGKLTYPVSFVVAKEAAPMDKEINSVEGMLGTGPFRAKSYQTDQLFTLEAFKDYHGGAPKVASIERPIIIDSQTRLQKYRNGDLDLVQIQRQDAVAARNDPAVKDELKFYPRPSIFYVGMNLKEYPQFADPRVRQAFYMAIDRDRIVKEILAGMVDRADTILPPGVIGHRDHGAGYAFDVAKAKQLLADAGFPDGKGFPKLEISFREGYNDIRLVAESVVEQLHQNLGINSSLKVMEWRSYLTKHNAKHVGFFHMRWAADYLDPQDFLSLMLSTNGAENKTWYSNPEVDRLCSQADAELDQAKRLSLYAQAEDLVLKDAAWIPIYYQKDAELIRPRVKGLRESLFGHLPHTTVSVR